MSDRRELATLLVALGEYYERPLQRGVLALYVDALATFEIADVKRATRAHVEDPDRGRFFPKIAELIARIQPPASSASAIDDQAGEWWELVVERIREGKYNTGCPMADAAMRRVGVERLRNMGDGSHGTESRTFLRRDFLQAWRDYATARPVEYAQTMGFDGAGSLALIHARSAVPLSHAAEV